MLEIRRDLVESSLDALEAATARLVDHLEEAWV